MKKLTLKLCQLPFKTDSHSWNMKKRPSKMETAAILLHYLLAGIKSFNATFLKVILSEQEKRWWKSVEGMKQILIIAAGY